MMIKRRGKIEHGMKKSFEKKVKETKQENLT
jgi:hypothetical protein